MTEPLPPFPTDDRTLDLLWRAVRPDLATADKSDLFLLLESISGSGGAAYHQNDVISALITEVRTLRMLRQRERRWLG